MAELIPFPNVPSKLAFRKSGVSRRRTDPDQLDMFHQPPRGKVLSLPPRTSPFEEALARDEAGDLSASDYYRRAIDAGDYPSGAYCNLGVLSVEAGKPSEAIDFLTLALVDNPRHLESHYNLGNIYFDEGDFKLARLHFEICVRIDPDFSYAHFNLAVSHLMLENEPSALICLDRYLELVPEDNGNRARRLLIRLKEITQA